ncbi:hypothetical protein [Candidatus Fokinia crypta]|uniref:Uncharacterized protein n=1 Tax=Candidatus Fokinia crypta TaxID=1920990 RepID=A0ABZ0US27_9RICK|nr:hypothetical protein [Candidatus Fokinia cryptica]WPX97953.1 hypothetical protein Fokcrypt_00478 [Candidatus Fokinia cryptica]
MINRTNLENTEDFLLGDIKDLLDRDLIRKYIHKFCDEILLYSPEILQFILRKNGEVSWEELIQNYPLIMDSPKLACGVYDLHILILEGQSYFIPRILQNDERVNAVMSSIARPIFIEEAQMMLQSQECAAPNNSSNLQHNQQQAPSLEQSQYTIAGDETHDSDNDLSDL